MTSTPLVSICITNHDYGRFVGAAVESALAQTHPAVEVVVVDDGSTDASLDVLAAYAGRVTVVAQPNAGQGAAVNAGFARSRGEVVLFLDADDELLPTVVEQVVDVLAQDPEVVDVQFLGALVDADGAPLGATVPRTAALLGTGDLRDVVLRHRCYPWQPTSGHAYRRTALEQVLPLPAHEYRTAADSYLSELVPLLGHLAVLDDVGFRYRMHGANDSLAGELDGAWFRVRIDRIVRAHREVRALARRLGLRPVPEDVRDPADPALLSYRLASLRLEPAAHPFPDDRRGGLTVQGLRAVLAHPLLTPRSRLARALWFLVVGLAPDAVAAHVVRSRTPDVPRTTRRRPRDLPADGVRRRGSGAQRRRERLADQLAVPPRPDQQLAEEEPAA